ncbi:MAG: restriction endonuclease subunit S, partial [Bacteroidales bacterium]|nr:restriction endonuclease subunit S [Bacteroidales bacterium]
MKHNWEYKRLGDLCNISSSRRVLQSDWKESGVPFYRAREIVKLSENGFVNNELFISENLYDELAKSGIPQAGDIMLSAVGTLGATYIVKPTDKFYYKDASVICLSKISDLQPKFLCYLFDSNIILHQIDRQAKGATVGTITISNASKFKVPVPDYKVQEQIVAELDKINEVIADCRELLRNLDALAQSLFYDYFGDP